MLVPDLFDLDLTVRSHGWYDLAPWKYDAVRRVLARPLRLSTSRVVGAEVAEGPGGLLFRVLATGRPTAAEAREAQAQVRAALGLEEDLGPFRTLASALEVRRAAAAPAVAPAGAGTRPEAGTGVGTGGTGAGHHPPRHRPSARRARDAELPDLRWALSRGAGRLLRSPTVFEDAVKTLCTTNCSWALTRAMVGRLCETLGEPGPGGERAFPTPAALAARPESFFRDTIRAGYRAPFLRTLGREVASGRLDLEALRDAPLSSAELRRRLQALDGFGPYAAEHLARLLGRHDFLALDSWTRERLRVLRGRRRPPGDALLRRWFAPYGAYAGLAMWLEVTADWHEDEPTWPRGKVGER